MHRLALVWLLLLAACSGGLSRQVREEAVPLASFEELRRAPDRFEGRTVILGGEILETRNRPDGTTLVVLERPLAFNRRPVAGDATGGRFKVRFAGYLDPAVYEPGRLVTVAGRVDGVVHEAVGDAPYPYVLLEGRELTLWEPDPPPDYYPYYPPYPPVWYPYGFPLRHPRW